MTTKAQRLAADRRLINRAKREVERLGQFLGVTQTWSIVVDVDDLDGGSAAQVKWNKHYKKATIVFDRKNLRTASAMVVEAYTLHELLHLVFAPLDDAVKEHIGENSRVFWAYADQREGVVDVVSHLVLRARNGKDHVHTGSDLDG